MAARWEENWCELFRQFTNSRYHARTQVDAYADAYAHGDATACCVVHVLTQHPKCTMRSFDPSASAGLKMPEWEKDLLLPL